MNEKKTKSILKEVRSWVMVVVIAFSLSFLINSQVFAKVIVQYSSMENTLLEDQHLLVDEISYRFSEPKRGDIITFYRYENKGSIINDIDRFIDRFSESDETLDEHERLVKRVIGVEGDVIDIRDGYVYLNGEKLEETYIKGNTDPKGMKLPITVGKNELFVMGDNRVVSIDSRELGMISIKQVEGKVIYRLYPFNLMGKLN